MPYNPFFPTTPQYNGYANYPVSAQPMPQQHMQNALPQQQVLQANGKASIDALRLAPNSSVLVMDSSAPIIWLCVSDGIGTVTSKAYDITEHKDAPVVNADMEDLHKRLDAVEKRIEEVLKNESHARNAEHIETVGTGI